VLTNRYWGSISRVGAYLFGIGLLELILFNILAIAGLVIPTATIWLMALVSIIVPVIATRAYLDWKWHWKPEHIGFGWRPTSLLWLGVGLMAGVVVVGLSVLAEALLVTHAIALPSLSLNGTPVITVIFSVLSVFAIEMVWRGVVLARFQADFDPQEALIAACVAPFAWAMISSLLGYGFPDTGINLAAPYTMPMSIALTLLVLRTDSVWLAIGLRAAMMGLLPLINPSPTATLIVWAIVAGILLLLAWRNQQQNPKKMQPRRGEWGKRGHTIRGPLGPH
jgi:membrane protease YdiL (CAAX protease family)